MENGICWRWLWHKSWSFKLRSSLSYLLLRFVNNLLQFTGSSPLCESSSISSHRSSQVRLGSKAPLADLITNVTFFTLLDSLGFPLVSAATTLLRLHLQTACIWVTLCSACRTSPILWRHFSCVCSLTKVGKVLRWVIFLRVHENFLVSLQAVAIIGADRAWFECLPGLLSVVGLLA